MDKITKQTESAEDLQAKQEELERQANQFKAGVTKLKKDMNRKNNKLTAMICCLFCCCPCVAMAE